MSKPNVEIPIISLKLTPGENKSFGKPTHARIAHVEVTPNGILIKAIHLHDENGEYIRDAKLNGQLLCTLTEHLLKIMICK